MLFIHTWQKVLDGTKTQTRRLQDWHDQYYGVERGENGKVLPAGVFNWSGPRHDIARPKYIVGKTYAVQPGRTKRTLFYRYVDGVMETTIDRDDLKHWTKKALIANGWRELRIRITDIREEDVRNISDADVKAEGFKYKYDFLQVWTDMHDPETNKLYSDYMGKNVPAKWSLTTEYDPLIPDHCPVFLWRQPEDRYLAWVLTFCLEVAK